MNLPCQCHSALTGRVSPEPQFMAYCNHLPPLKMSVPVKPAGFSYSNLKKGWVGGGISHTLWLRGLGDEAPFSRQAAAPV